MLTVDVEKRYTIDECLEHPWTVQQDFNPADSTDGLTGAMHQLDFTKRKPQRERTLLSSINDVQVEESIPLAKDQSPVKVFVKNKGQPSKHSQSRGGLEEPAKAGAANEELFGEDDSSRYLPE